MNPKIDKSHLFSLFLIIVATTLWAGPLHIEKNCSTKDLYPDWYFFHWAINASYIPTFEVLDTESSLGHYAGKTKTITLKDLVKMHGHLCDGLVTAACALKLGLNELYPDGIIDRTDTCGITNNSPCFGDIMAYLTGARIRFGTQKIDPKMGNEFIIHSISTGQTVKVALKQGMFPQVVMELEKKLKSGKFTKEEMDLCQKLQWEFAKKTLSQPLENSFMVEKVSDFKWQPDDYSKASKRGDVINKNAFFDQDVTKRDRK